MHLPLFRLPCVVNTVWNVNGGFRKDGTGGVLYLITYMYAYLMPAHEGTQRRGVLYQNQLILTPNI
jgi:hypothetical protein